MGCIWVVSYDSSEISFEATSKLGRIRPSNSGKNFPKASEELSHPEKRVNFPFSNIEYDNREKWHFNKIKNFYLKQSKDLVYSIYLVLQHGFKMGAVTICYLNKANKSYTLPVLEHS